MNRVAYCITTMKRPQALERLLLSIAAHRPEASVHVADQNENFDDAYYESLAGKLTEAGLAEGLAVYSLPFDCGVSAARNFLADSTPHEYKLILDDDFVFTDDTDIDALVRLLDAYPEAGAAGGSVIRGGSVRNGGSRLEKRGACLFELPIRDPLEEHDGIRFWRTNCVPVFVLMREELCAQVQWDPNLKTAGEHFDFFLRMEETPYVVLHAPDVTVDHPPIEAEPSYRQLRLRGEFLKRMMRKHDIVRQQVVDGTVTELGPDGELTRYSELNPGVKIRSRTDR